MCEAKKLFICSVKGMNTNYSVLANDSNEAKKMVVESVNKTYRDKFNHPYIAPYSETDIYFIDTEGLKEHMLNNNTEIEVL